MSIIFKDSYFSDEEREDIKEKESLELALVLLDKLGSDNYKIFKIQLENDLPFYALREIKQNGFGSTIIDIEAESSLNMKSNNISVDEISNVSELFKIADKNLIAKYEKLLGKFNNTAFNKTLHDKNGDEYTFSYRSNYQISPLGEGSDDILSVSNSNGESIGYLKAIYTREEDYKNLNPTIIHEVLNFHNNGYNISKNSTKKELLVEVIDNYSEIKNIDLNNVEDSFNMVIDVFKEKYSYILNDRQFDLATIMYVSINDEYDNESKVSYRGRGLAQLMYFEVAKELNKKGLKFRSSTNQTNDAKRTWMNLKNNLKNNIKEISFYDTTVFELNVSEGENLSYINGELKHSSINSFLKTKPTNLVDKNSSLNLKKRRL